VLKTSKAGVQYYDLPEEVSKRDYHGCGKAWAAIRDGEVVAVRYMSPTVFDENQQLEPHAELLIVRVPMPMHDFCDHARRDVPQLGFPAVAALAKAAGLVKHLIDYTRTYRAEDEAADAALLAAFAAYRLACRADLAALGEVKSGTLSCYRFCL
jgi:hypothetical protein